MALFTELTHNNIFAVPGLHLIGHLLCPLNLYTFTPLRQSICSIIVLCRSQQDPCVHGSKMAPLSIILVPDHLAYHAVRWYVRHLAQHRIARLLGQLPGLYGATIVAFWIDKIFQLFTDECFFRGSFDCAHFAARALAIDASHQMMSSGKNY